MRMSTPALMATPYRIRSRSSNTEGATATVMDCEEPLCPNQAANAGARLGHRLEGGADAQPERGMRVA